MISVGYRFQPSSRHFIGDVEQSQREEGHNQIQNTYHLFDVNLSRDIGTRWNANVSIPFMKVHRNQLYPPRGIQEMTAIGDMTIGVRRWMFRPPTEFGGNIGIGINLKLPTGNYNQGGPAIGRDGNPVIATFDQSIMTGDGGTGFSLDVQGYQPIPFSSMLYFSGSYLFNPRDTNGVSTFRTRPGEEEMSVSDQYLFRAGVSRGVPKVPWLTATFGGRVEGVPVSDLLGDSNGFRRPGFAVSIDPGLMVSTKGYVFSINSPWAVYRNRLRSLTDIQNNFHGDAAFADFAIVVGFSKRF